MPQRLIVESCGGVDTRENMRARRLGLDLYVQG